MATLNADYYRRHAEIERQAARRAQDPRTRDIHEQAARLYEALVTAAGSASQRPAW